MSDKEKGDSDENQEKKENREHNNQKLGSKHESNTKHNKEETQDSKKPDLHNSDKNNQINQNKEVSGNRQQIQILKLGEETWNNITSQTHKLENEFMNIINNEDNFKYGIQNRMGFDNIVSKVVENETIKINLRSELDSKIDLNSNYNAHQKHQKTMNSFYSQDQSRKNSQVKLVIVSQTKKIQNPESLSTSNCLKQKELKNGKTVNEQQLEGEQVDQYAGLQQQSTRRSISQKVNSKNYSSQHEQTQSFQMGVSSQFSQNQGIELQKKQIKNNKNVNIQKQISNPYIQNEKKISTQNQSEKLSITKQKTIKNNENDFNHLPEDYSQNMIKIFVYIQFFAYLFINVDMGILPAGSTKIKHELNIENSQFGTLGSVVYLGQTIGSAMATVVLSKYNIKIVLSSCLFLNIASLIIFTLTDNYSVLVVCRIFTGLFQVFFCIYFPVWADIYGNVQQKSSWMTFILLANPLGVIMGYGLCAALLENMGWRFAFYIQSFFLVPSLFGVMMIPQKYVDVQGTTKLINLMKKQGFKQILQNSNGEVVNTDTEKIDSTTERYESNKNFMVHSNTQQSDNIESQNNRSKKQQQNSNIIDTQSTEENEEAQTDKTYSLYQNITKVLSNKIFCLLCGSISGLFFVITGIQYWISDYWITELKVPDTVVFTSFGIISITAPILGLIAGGNLTSNLGGFKSKQALRITQLIAMLTIFCSIPIPFLSDFKTVAALLWFLLFFGGAVLPNITGIMLNTIDGSLKTTANSLANLSYNLIGYLPAPFIYGAIYDSGEGKNSRLAMGALMFSPIISITALQIGAYYLVKSDILEFKKHEQPNSSKIIDEDE